MFRERVLSQEVWLPRPRADVFRFFADAGNLDALTPPWMSFTIVTPRPIDMREGAVIDYRLRIRGVPIHWRTLITRWEPPHCFIDEQVKGPYLQWIHEHTFEECVGPDAARMGTTCRDSIRYKHIGGPVAQALMVGPDLARVFAYRTLRLQELFTAVTA